MRSISIPLFILCLFVSLSHGQSPEEEEFLKGFKGVKTLMEHRRWDKAKGALKDLLDAHQEADYVRVRQMEIEECMKKCCFRASYDEPDPKSLVSGELLSYKPSTGDIKLRYTPDSLADFKRQETKSGGKSNTYIHPVLFAGPHTIEVKGSRYPSRTRCPQLLCCLFEDEGYALIFGCKAEAVGMYMKWVSPGIYHLKGGESENVASKDSSPATEGKPFRIKIKVGKSDIVGYFNGKLLLKAKKQKSFYGCFGFINLPFDEILVKGKVQTSWIQGLSDVKEQEARLEFEKDYRAGHHLPTWLFGKPKGEVAKSEKKKVPFKTVPGPEFPDQHERVSKAREYFDEKRFRSGLRYVTGLSEGEITVEAREFLQAVFLKALRKFEEAMDHCRRACELDPDCLSSRKLFAALLASMRMEEEAEREYRVLLEEFPDKAELYEELAKLLLLDGRPDEAKKVVDRAVLRNIANFELNLLNKTLVNAMNGPVWGRTYEYESKHYHIFSDIDRATCTEASKILEESYVSYIVYLERIPDLEKDKFRVYLFSGEAGYQMYLKDMEMAFPIRSAGLYTPALRQLLIWNTPDRDAMMQTVRHEGFHQYFHRLIKESPIWLDEGMAGYYEIAKKERGKWKVGEIHPQYRRLLTYSKTKLNRLEDLIYMDRMEFLKNASLNYAQSWAFVNFLRHTTRENRSLFSALFETLQRDMPMKAALDEVFGEVDLDKLDAEFKIYVNQMK